MKIWFLEQISSISLFILEILVPKKIKYSNQYIEWGARYQFQYIYLILFQNKAINPIYLCQPKSIAN